MPSVPSETDVEGLVDGAEAESFAARVGELIDACEIDLPPNDVVESIEFERFFVINARLADFQRPVTLASALASMSSEDLSREDVALLGARLALGAPLSIKERDWDLLAASSGGTIYASEKAKQQFAELVVDVAMRDGAASRVAFEALGADKDALAALRRRQLELDKAGGEPSRQAFEDGVEMVGTYLDGLEDQRDATIAAWKEKYAKNANADDLDRIAHELTQLLDAYVREPRPLDSLIKAL